MSKQYNSHLFIVHFDKGPESKPSLTKLFMFWWGRVWVWGGVEGQPGFGQRLKHDQPSPHLLSLPYPTAPPLIKVIQHLTGHCTHLMGCVRPSPTLSLPHSNPLSSYPPSPPSHPPPITSLSLSFSPQRSWTRNGCAIQSHAFRPLSSTVPYNGALSKKALSCV